MKTRIFEKLRRIYPLATDRWCEATAEALAGNLVPELQVNLQEWLADKPFTDVRIHGKYTLTEVLEIYGGNIANALLALDVYACDPAREAVLFPEVM